MDTKKIGEFIYKLRIQKGYTQSDLADKLNVTNKAVSKWERGIGVPDISLLEPLSNELDVSILELLHGEIMEVKKTNEKKCCKKNYKKMILIVSISIMLFLIFFHYVIKRSDVIYDTFSTNDLNYTINLKILIQGLIPFDELHDAIILPSLYFKNFISSVLANIIVSSLISVFILCFINEKKKYFKILIVINILLEFVKWILLVKCFDIDDIIVRLIISFITYKIYNKINKNNI